MRRALPLLIATLALAALLPAAASARGGKGGWPGHGHGAAPIAAADFLTKAAQGNRFEIATGELAQQRAGADAIRALGALLVRDHTALQQQGDAVAAALGVTVAPGLDRKHQALVDRLARLDGGAFDRAWLRTQIWAHHTSLALHLRGAIRGDAPEIRRLAGAALPTIAHHLGDLLDLAAADRAARRGARSHDDHRDRHGARHGDKRGHDRGRGHDRHRKQAGRR